MRKFLLGNLVTILNQRIKTNRLVGSISFAPYCLGVTVIRSIVGDIRDASAVSDNGAVVSFGFGSFERATNANRISAMTNMNILVFARVISIVSLLVNCKYSITRQRPAFQRRHEITLSEKQ
jgi:hypothetical protein